MIWPIALLVKEFNTETWQGAALNSRYVSQWHSRYSPEPAGERIVRTTPSLFQLWCAGGMRQEASLLLSAKAREQSTPVMVEVPVRTGRCAGR